MITERGWHKDTEQGILDNIEEDYVSGDCDMEGAIRRVMNMGFEKEFAIRKVNTWSIEKARYNKIRG